MTHLHNVYICKRGAKSFAQFHRVKAFACPVGLGMSNVESPTMMIYIPHLAITHGMMTK
ncbi:MAG: hypothetical protein IKT03_04435 [Muribaculaceae bacterium]|nr:hypothetical protein [Muribaculaceae bacterium]